MLRKSVFSMACLAAACGGGGTPEDNSGNNDPVNDPANPADPAVLMGTLRVAVNPALVGAQPVRLRLDGTMMSGIEIAPGSEAAVELEAGTHTLGLVCPDYCWATPTGTWDSNTRSCDEWELDLEVPENGTASLDATLCRDLKGRWMLEGSSDHPRDAYMISANGHCTTRNMPLFGLEVLGDQVRPEEGNGAWVTILDNGWRVEIEGLTFTRLE